MKDARIAPVLIVAVLLFLWRADCPLLEPEEARYAEIPRQMLDEGRLVVPVLHGEDYVHKPPLMYWLVMGCYRLLGVADWVARLVPALAGLTTIAVVYFWAKATVGNRAALASAVILALTPEFVYRARMLTLDGLLCLWVVAGWAAWERGRWLLAGVCCGLGLLTKGPVALVLVGMPAGLWWWIDARSPRWWYGVASVASAAVVAAPWYVALAVVEPEAAREFFWLHNVQRYVAPFDHIQPWWYFLPRLLVGMLPWSLLALPLAQWTLRHRREMPPGLVYFALCLAWTMVFFSASGCKRPGYILPAFPAFALVLGTALAWRWGEEEPSVWRPNMWLWSAAAVAFLFVVTDRVLSPGYHRSFGLRQQVSTQSDLVRWGGLQVACYPKRWDSVSFYLQHDQVRVFGTNDREAMLAFLEAGPTLLFVKEGAWRAWTPPSTLEWEVVGRQERLGICVVRVRPMVAIQPLRG